MTTPTVAVLDSNGIIGLAKADCFPLLQHLFTETCVPPTVVAEITKRFYAYWERPDRRIFHLLIFQLSFVIG
jgi:hypothetical protein